MTDYDSITARNVPEATTVLKSAKVAIAGLGGLGSNIAVMLARIGVGKLFLVDFDKVEPSNLNRQHYNTKHLGMYKTEALKNQIGLINPFIETEILTIKVEEENAAEIFADYRIVCEAFDNPQYKSILVNALLQNGNTKIVAASGMAGFDSANRIKTECRFENLYVCGDYVPAAEGGIGLMAPRVAICAGHQANMVVRLIMNIKKV
ncbi:MAG: sulfur carrier protein ThiS adenylyltransferase ThiF [Oscillospiraceae bacterium]|nr:sulfur carrier protein ThiS adenylyltransferase ThiF [Oscillospiraceae bacterium]